MIELLTKLVKGPSITVVEVVVVTVVTVVVVTERWAMKGTRRTRLTRNLPVKVSHCLSKIALSFSLFCPAHVGQLAVTRVRRFRALTSAPVGPQTARMAPLRESVSVDAVVPSETRSAAGPG